MTARVPDLNGFYTIDRNPISAAGVFPYTKKSIGYPGWEEDPGGIIMVWRPAAELADPETLKSFQLLPWTNEHAMIGNPELDASLTPIEKKGAHGTTGEKIEFDPTDEKLYANIKLWSSSLADAIDAGKKDLSMGFRCVYEFVAGIFKGQSFQAIQRCIRGNHQASVPDGRVPGAIVLDHFSFALDANELREVTPMKSTRGKNTAKKLGIAEDALPAHFGVTGADAIKNFKTAMDAEEDSAEGDAPATGMTLEAITETIKDAAGPLAELNEALSMIAGGAPTDDVEDPNAALDDDMEPVIDTATGAAKKNPDGSPMMQKKVAPAAPVVDADAIGTKPAVGIAAMDAAVSGFDVLSRNAHAALNGRAAPASLVAMDAAIKKAKATVATAKKKGAKKVKPGTATDAAELRTAVTELAATVKGLTGPAVMQATMDEMANRDVLAKRVSAFTGVFDHSKMTTKAVAQYALGKFGVAAMDGQEIGQVEAYLHGRQPEAAKIASGFGQDAAPSKPNAYINDFIAGRPAA